MRKKKKRIDAGWRAVLKTELEGPGEKRAIFFSHAKKGGPYNLRTAMAEHSLLKDVVEERGITQQKIMQRLKCSRKTLYRWIYGRGRPQSRIHRDKIYKFLLE